MKKWLCYFMNSANQRDGAEYIQAESKDEALRMYIQFFNMSRYDDCRAIPVVDEDTRWVK